MLHPRMARQSRRLGAVGIGLVLIASLTFLPAATAVSAPPVRPGRVVSWGGPTALPAPPTELGDAVAIAAIDVAGAYSNLALRANGTVVGWGSNAFGEASPPETLADATAIDLGVGFGLALTRGGQVVAWGTNESGQLDVPKDLGTVTAISAGGYLGYRGLDVAPAQCGFALALRRDGTVSRWGQDAPGLGCEQIGAQLDPPTGLEDVVAISAGSRQALALRADGTVVAWGSGAMPGFDGTPPDQWSNIVAVSAGNGNNLGLRSDGTVAAYGIWGESGPPVEADVVDLAAGNVDVFLHRDGTLSTYRDIKPPAATKGAAFQAVTAGDDYGLAIEAAADEPSAPVLGSSDVQPWVDANPAGTAEAFRYAASTSRSVSTGHVYLDESSEATEVIVGLYADADGEPGKLLASGSSANVVNGQWNAIPIDSVALSGGVSYWLALLAPNGTIRFRDLPDGDGGPTRLSDETELTASCGLPGVWKTRREYANAPASLYAD